MKLNLNTPRLIRSAAGIATVLLTIPSCRSVKDNDQPNIVLLLADDLGYGDLQCYSPDGISTPAIESIVNQGVRFTTCYSNGPESSPTRTALLTGRYQQRVGGLECALGIGNVGRYDDAERLRKSHDLGLPVSEISIGQMLKETGYKTALCGKWHLGYERNFIQISMDLTIRFIRSEERWIIFTTGKESTTLFKSFFRNGNPAEEDGYFTGSIADESVKFLEAQTNKKPFFLYVPFTSPHAPFQGPDDYLPEILPDSSKLWDQSKGPKNTYEAMITRMDKAIDKILLKLDEKGLAENTIVIFMSDNGGTRSGSNGPLNGFKGNMFEGGIRVPCAVKWPGKIPAGIISEQVCLTFDFTASLARIAGAKLPSGRTFDGIDILKKIEENQPVEKRTVFWRARRGNETRKAARQGEMKYIWLSTNGKTNEYLFNLGNDFMEKTNLIDSLPDTAAKLKALLKSWEEEVKPVR